MAKELRLELLEVFDNSVVNADYIHVIAAVRVRVELGGLSVCRPSGVTDSAETRNGGAVVGFVLQLRKPSLCLDNDCFVSIAYGDSRRIIAAVFQPRQPLQKNGSCLTVAGISYYSTHDNTLLFFF